MYVTISDYSNTLIYRFAYRYRRFIITFCLLILLILAIGVIGPHLRARPYSDDAYYLVVAKSLSQGTGLRVVSNPEMPLATLSPPGYPFILSGVVRIFGLASTLPYRLLNTVFWFGTIIMTGLLVEREDKRVWGFLLAFLTALNVVIMEYAKGILTELPYMFVATAVLILVYRYVESKASGRWMWLIPIVLGLSILIYLRMIGISLVAAVTLFLVIRQRVKAGLLVGGIVSLVYLPWIIVGIRKGLL
jgi:4-amino-4-deoxy-L-arabinose transferase-like glycosyltransferase